MMHSAPMLETPRLRLRAHTPADFPACCALWGDPAVTHYLMPQPSTREEVWSARILRYAGHWSLLGFGYWLVEERHTGAFVGEVGFADYHREIDSTLAQLPDLGWVLMAAMHGKGYATEAASAALAWATTHLVACDEVSCVINTENAASVRVAEKLGFHRRETAAYRNHPVLLLSKPLRA